ncbi:hypothetical protein EIN_095000 [Entamoeba invadens IP1]|uniref:Uncharacterized protein n=1 Tax=Entamoeba invadens IP1 TaxID=370355 RepID=A0A0A1U3D4_ENTIV|nr:hypothetical protein EIN_095000 [Entamoeba invadens IP1]ELP87263.1 hypothetical protein EIN_095000 [Entamoeba invadens IP1]|eukprot:XP_004254034.1 hypothetical protein EIN_095000 [Entamoeba invadens IP1]
MAETQDVLDKKIESLKTRINDQERVLRQMLWFGDYSFASEQLHFDRDGLKIECRETAPNKPYALLFLYIPINSFSIRVIQGKASIGFITLNQPIPLDCNISVISDQTKVLMYDRTYIGPLDLTKKQRSNFVFNDGVVTTTFNPATNTISFEQGKVKDDDVFVNVYEEDLYPLIAFKDDTVIQVL